MAVAESSSSPHHTSAVAEPEPTSVGCSGLTVEFCGVHHRVVQSAIIGRDADVLVGDDNRYVHRRFLEIRRHDGMWLMANIGDRLSAIVSDGAGRLKVMLGPGAAVPLLAAHTVVRFTAGPTDYEFTVEAAEHDLGASLRGSDRLVGDHTVGRVSMTPDQMRLVLALAEPALRDGWRGAVSVPTSASAARRLGWPLTKFNRKLDNVCQKLAADGVRGLHGGPGCLAAHRRTRLVEHAIMTRLVERGDLALLGEVEGAPR